MFGWNLVPLWILRGCIVFCGFWKGVLGLLESNARPPLVCHFLLLRDGLVASLLRNNVTLQIVSTRLRLAFQQLALC